MLCSPRALRALALIAATLVAILTGCGTGDVAGGTALGLPPTPLSTASTIEVQLTFPPETVTKTVSAAALPFAQTTVVTVSVLDPTTHKKVVPSVTQARPVETRTINGPWIIRKVASSPKTQSASELAYNMTVTIPGVPAGTYLVYVQCFNDSGASCGDTVPQATCRSGETVVVPVNDTLSLVSVAVTPSTATVAVGGTQQLTATATYSDNSKEDATYVATWTAFDVLNKQASASAAVDVASTTGLVTGVSVGIAEVFAKVSGVQSLPAQITVGGVTPTPPLAWSTPPANLTATGQGVEQTQVAVSADGTKATAVWQRNSPNGRVIQTASAVISGNSAVWGPTYTLFAVSGSNGQRPQIAVSADGTRATAVWVGSDGANTIVESASATISGNAATWGSPTDLAAAGQNSNLPQLGLSADGTKATAVWYRFDGSNFLIESASATITGTSASWGSLSSLSAAGQNADTPQVALSADGSMATALWTRNDGLNDIVQTASATVSGNVASWGSATDLSAAGQDAAYPQIGLSADGTMASAIWTRSNGTNPVVQSRSATITGNVASWGSTTERDAEPGEVSESPQIALSADGARATVVWVQGAIGNKVIWASSATISGNTASWGDMISLPDASYDSITPQVALSVDGTRAIAVWARSDGSNFIIQSSSALINGNVPAWGAPTDISAAGQDASEPQISASADGTRATAVWFRYDGSDNIIQTASYGPPSVP